jgi:lycopene cyclase CruA
MSTAQPAQPAVASSDLLDALRQTHPHTVAAFEGMDALGQLAAVAALDRRWAALERGEANADLHRTVDVLAPCDGEWDLIYAGGGLGLLHALVMQRRGYRVLVFDRDDVGRAHREWNISDAELEALVRLGVFDREELRSIVAHRHERGVVRFHSATIAVPPAELWMTGVLDVSLDAAELLRHVRAKFEAAGGTVLDQRTLLSVEAAPHAVAVTLGDSTSTTQRLRARLLLDAMGATSPLAMQRHRGQPFAGVCPTVGSTVCGLERGPAPTQHDPTVGDILVSVADAQNGQQLIWEGFAGRDDQLTVYLFYYDRVGVRYGTHSLLDLFEQYFRLLPTYKRPGPHFRHLKPVYGFIPARHTERRSTAPPLRGVLPVGDAAAQQSPLTFTGFGSHVRNLERTTALLDYALRWELLDPRWLGEISAYQSNVALHWVFSRFMHPWAELNTVNQLQNVFARVLNDLGTPVAERFFKDQMRWRDYGHIVNHTLAVYRPIIATALTVLGPRDTARWVLDYLRFTRAAAVAAVGGRIGARGWRALERWAERVHPGWSLVLRSRRAEWRAMGWLDVVE